MIERTNLIYITGTGTGAVIIFGITPLLKITNVHRFPQVDMAVYIIGSVFYGSQ